MNCTNRIFTSLSLAILTWCSLTHSLCRADFLFEFGEVVFNAGQQGSIDVFISSSTSVTIGSATYKLHIASSGTVSGQLVFAPTQTPDELDQDNYVFRNHSGGWTAAREGNQIDLLGSDFADTDATIDSSKKLLARVELSYIKAPISTNAADQFSIELIQDKDLTAVFDADGNSLAINSQSYAASGAVTIQISAVPEPSSLLLTCLMSAALAVRASKKRGKQPTGASPG